MDTVKVDIFDLRREGRDFRERVIIRFDLELPFENGAVICGDMKIETGLPDIETLDTKLIKGKALLVVFPEACPMFEHLLFALAGTETVGVARDGAIVRGVLLGSVPKEVVRNKAILTSVDHLGTVHVVSMEPGNQKYSVQQSKAIKTLNNRALVFFPKGITRIASVVPNIERDLGIFSMLFAQKAACWSPSIGDKFDITQAMLDPDTLVVVMRLHVADTVQTVTQNTVGVSEEYRFFLDQGSNGETIEYGGALFHCPDFWAVMRDASYQSGLPGPQFVME